MIGFSGHADSMETLLRHANVVFSRVRRLGAAHESGGALIVDIWANNEGQDQTQERIPTKSWMVSSYSWSSSVLRMTQCHSRWRAQDYYDHQHCEYMTRTSLAYLFMS
jgi:hypothetical protein